MGRGEWERSGARWTVESVLAVDVRELRRRGLRPGASVVTWAGRCAVECIDEHTVQITYSRDQHDEQPVRQRVDLERTPCNYGGERAWWKCPKCGRRCAVLYWFADRFQCRPCAGLTYTTAQSSQWIRSSRRTAKLGQRIGVQRGARYVTKPRGMHRRTFERLVAEYKSASRSTMAALGPMLERWENDRVASRQALGAEMAAETAALDSAPDLDVAARAQWRAALELAADLLDPPT